MKNTSGDGTLAYLDGRYKQMMTCLSFFGY